jgi:hypothetical protein
LAIFSPTCSVNHRLPSGPKTILNGCAVRPGGMVKGVSAVRVSADVIETTERIVNANFLKVALRVM